MIYFLVFYIIFHRKNNISNKALKLNIYNIYFNLYFGFQIYFISFQVEAGSGLQGFV